MSNSKVSIILPAYKEKENLLAIIPAIDQVMNSSGILAEIVVANDESGDGTIDALSSLKATLKGELSLVNRTTNRGFAYSIREGIEKSTGDIVLIMDSDFNHQPKYLPFMVHALSFYDCVSGSRFVYGGMMNSRSRHILSWLFNIFVRIMTGGKITDSLYGFLAIRRKDLEKVNFDNVFWGYGDYCIRLMYYLQMHKLNVLQFPAENGRRAHGEGNSNFIKVFWQYFREVMKLTFRIRITKNV